MRATAILETCLYAEGLEETARFYEEVLGLRALSRVEGRHVFFRCGRGMLLLFDPRATGASPGDVPAHGAHGPGHLAFAADPADLPAWRRHLTSRGVPIEAEVEWPRGGASLYFRDPAGNSLELAAPGIWGIDAGAAEGADARNPIPPSSRDP